MYGYLVFLTNLWLISSNETPPKENELINHTPVILTMDTFGEFHYPKKAEITKDQNQDYFYWKKQDGRYYCPIEHTEENVEFGKDIENTKKSRFEYCLFKTKFKKGKTPICEKEPEPLLVAKKDENGHTSCGSGRLYKFVYQVCVEKSPVAEFRRRATLKYDKGKDVFSDVQHPHLYEVCFGDSGSEMTRSNNYRTLFTKHKIRSPYIIRNLILDEENSLHKYPDTPLTNNYDFKTFNILAEYYKAYEAQKKNEAEAIETAKKEALKSGKPRKFIFTYTLVQLIPWGEFALGHWKKTTFHMINYSPMFERFQPVWRAINIHIYNRLIQKYDELGDVDIFTGTYGDSYDNNGKIYLGNFEKTGFTVPAIWWKLLYAPNIKTKPYTIKGIVFIMHTTGDFVPMCEESGTACDPRTWVMQIDPQFYKYVYCCKLETAKQYISTIGQLRIFDVDKVKLLDLG